MENFTQNGLVMIQRELRQELADKRKEVSRLRELAIDLRELAEGEDWRDPVEVAYSHTVRKAEGLGTKTETLTLADTGEAEEAAAAFERKIEGWEKLRSQMQDDLEHRMRRLKEVAESVSAFALFSTGVVAEVLAIL